MHRLPTRVPGGLIAATIRLAKKRGRKDILKQVSKHASLLPLKNSTQPDSTAGEVIVIHELFHVALKQQKDIFLDFEGK